MPAELRCILGIPWIPFSQRTLLVFSHSTAVSGYHHWSSSATLLMQHVEKAHSNIHAHISQLFNRCRRGGSKRDSMMNPPRWASKLWLTFIYNFIYICWLVELCKRWSSCTELVGDDDDDKIIVIGLVVCSESDFLFQHFKTLHERGFVYEKLQ